MKKFFTAARQKIGGAKVARRVYRTLPSRQRCKECLVPFLGMFSVPFRVINIRPSRKNPSLCTLWYELAPPGGETRQISVMFVDVRGFTAMAERLSPAEVAERLNRFYKLATDAVFERDGTLDKMVGDQVMAFFGAPVHQHNHERRAVETAVEIVRGVMAAEEGLQVGAGVASGEAFVGNVGSGGVTDYTALGDTVNIAARLQGAAAAGEILLTEETYAAVKDQFPRAATRDLELKGKSGTVTARVIGAV